MRELPPHGWGGKHLGENCETRAETPPPTGSGKDQESGIPVKEQPEPNMESQNFEQGIGKTGRGIARVGNSNVPGEKMFSRGKDLPSPRWGPPTQTSECMHRLGICRARGEWRNTSEEWQNIRVDFLENGRGMSKPC